MTAHASPSHHQPDEEILAALAPARPDLTLSLERIDPARILVLGIDEHATDPQEVLTGLAVIDRPAGRWYLGCIGCEAEQDPRDGGYCPTCRDILAAETETATEAETDDVVAP